MNDSPIQKLAQIFIKFPGIGPRQAKRFVYYLLSESDGVKEALVSGIEKLRAEVAQCHECFRFFPLPAAGGADNPLCDLCLDAGGGQGLLLVVEKDIDLENIRKAGVYAGRYFVLGGLVIIGKVEPSETVRAVALFNLVKSRAGHGELKELIFALAASPEGDQTVEFLKEKLQPLIERFGLRLTVLGRGLPVGAEVEYSDRETLKSAFQNRG